MGRKPKINLGLNQRIKNLMIEGKLSTSQIAAKVGIPAAHRTRIYHHLGFRPMTKKQQEQRILNRFIHAGKRKPKIGGKAANAQSLLNYVLANQHLPSTTAAGKIGIKGGRYARLIETLGFGKCPPGKKGGRRIKTRQKQLQAKLKAIAALRQLAKSPSGSGRYPITKLTLPFLRENRQFTLIKNVGLSKTGYREIFEEAFPNHFYISGKPRKGTGPVKTRIIERH